MKRNPPHIAEVLYSLSFLAVPLWQFPGPHRKRNRAVSVADDLCHRSDHRRHRPPHHWDPLAADEESGHPYGLLGCPAAARRILAVLLLGHVPSPGQKPAPLPHLDHRHHIVVGGLVANAHLQPPCPFGLIIHGHQLHPIQ
jgi:hypothetical protein